MKTIYIFLSGCLLMCACNNDSKEKDSVDIADSANKANLDSPSVSQQPVQTDEASSSFLVKAFNGAMTEMHLGALAQQKGKNPGVKDFGSMMIHDHSADQDKIKILA